MTPEEAKAAGSAAWQAGKFEDAVGYFGDAIDASSPSDKDFLKILYSNRSAAYLKLGRHTPALLDANKCIEMDCDWAKGYIRKGDTLYAMKKFTECYNAYNFALRITPDDVSAKQKCELAQKAIRDASGDSSDAGPSSSRAAPSAKKGALSTAQSYLRIIVVVAALLFFIPFLGRGFSSACYRIFVFGAMTDFGISLFVAHGMPKFNMQYAQLVLLDPTSMYFFMSCLLLSAKPYLLAMMPILLTESAHITYHTYTVILNKMPQQLDRVTAVTDKYLPQIMQKTPEEWARLGVNTKWQLFNAKVVQMAGYCEVMQGLFLIIELIMPTRSFLFTMMWWQFLQMRYMMDQTGAIKNTFFALDRRIMGLLSHRLCPGIIMNGYGMLKAFLAKQVTPPQAGQEAPSLSGMMSKCSIM